MNSGLGRVALEHHSTEKWLINPMMTNLKNIGDERDLIQSRWLGFKTNSTLWRFKILSREISMGGDDLG